jgi:hypothetical protein
LARLVDAIILATRDEKTDDVQRLESEIDQMVLQIMGIPPGLGHRLENKDF